MFKFRCLKDLSFGDPRHLHGLINGDFRSMQLAKDVCETALRVQPVNFFDGSELLTNNYSDVYSSFEEYTEKWREKIVVVLNSDVSLFAEIIAFGRNVDFKIISESHQAMAQNIHDPTQDLLEGIRRGLSEAGLLVPRFDAWQRFFQKVTSLSVAWQQPAEVPSASRVWGPPEELQNILFGQLDWAAQNGRLAEALRHLGSIRRSEWITVA